MESAYAAGVFDGEGSVGLYATSNGKSEKVYWAVKLSVVGTHRPMIEALSEHFGVGSFTTQKRQTVRRTPSRDYEADMCKQGWRWSVQSKRDVAAVLREILPYLIEKREQAEAVLRYCEGDLDGETAARLCKAAKQFEFPLGDFDSYAPRVNSGNLTGASNPAASITENTARAIKQALTRGRKGVEVAEEFGVSKHLVSKIKTGKSWSHIAVEVSV